MGIPDGYKQIEFGDIQETDFCWNIRTKEFESVLNEFNAPQGADQWYCIIRKQEDFGTQSKLKENEDT